MSTTKNFTNALMKYAGTALVVGSACAYVLGATTAYMVVSVLYAKITGNMPEFKDIAPYLAILGGVVSYLIIDHKLFESFTQACYFILSGKARKSGKAYVRIAVWAIVVFAGARLLLSAMPTIASAHLISAQVATDSDTGRIERAGKQKNSNITSAIQQGQKEAEAILDRAEKRAKAMRENAQKEGDGNIALLAQKWPSSYKLWERQDEYFLGKPTETAALFLSRMAEAQAKKQRLMVTANRQADELIAAAEKEAKAVREQARELAKGFEKDVAVVSVIQNEERKIQRNNIINRSTRWMIFGIDWTSIILMVLCCAMLASLMIAKEEEGEPIDFFPEKPSLVKEIVLSFVSGWNIVIAMFGYVVSFLMKKEANILGRAITLKIQATQAALDREASYVAAGIVSRKLTDYGEGVEAKAELPKAAPTPLAADPEPIKKAENPQKQGGGGGKAAKSLLEEGVTDDVTAGYESVTSNTKSNSSNSYRETVGNTAAVTRPTASRAEMNSLRNNMTTYINRAQRAQEEAGAAVEIGDTDTAAKKKEVFAANTTIALYFACVILFYEESKDIYKGDLAGCETIARGKSEGAGAARRAIDWSKKQY